MYVESLVVNFPISLNSRWSSPADDWRGHPTAAGGASTGGETGGGTEEEGAPGSSPLHAGSGRKRTLLMFQCVQLLWYFLDPKLSVIFVLCFVIVTEHNYDRAVCSYRLWWAEFINSNSSYVLDWTRYSQAGWVWSCTKQRSTNELFLADKSALMGFFFFLYWAWLRYLPKPAQPLGLTSHVFVHLR